MRVKRTALTSATRLGVLRALQTNAGRPQKVMAHELDITEPTFSKAHAELRHGGMIKRTVAILDRQKLGFTALCFFRVECKNFAATERVRELLSADPAVQEMHRLDGAHPLFVKVVARTPAELATWQEKVVQYGDVTSVRGQMVMKTFHESLNVPI